MPPSHPSAPAVDSPPSPTVRLIEQAWAERPPAARALGIAAIEAFAEKGYHATTTRDIASRVGLSPAAMYVHYPSKEELLYAIALLGNERVIEVVSASSEIDDPTERLRALVRDYVEFLATYRQLVWVVLHEYRSLEPAHHQQISAMRRRTVAILRSAVQAGIDDGVFCVPDLTAVVIAIIALCADVTNWFPARGLSSPSQLGELYAELAVRMVAPAKATID